MKSNKRVERSKKTVRRLVGEGYRLNPNKASATYHKAVINKSTNKSERKQSRRELGKRATKGMYR